MCNSNQKIEVVNYKEKSRAWVWTRIATLGTGNVGDRIPGHLVTPNSKRIYTQYYATVYVLIISKALETLDNYGNLVRIL